MLEKLRELVSAEVRAEESMSRHTTFKIGGPAEFFLDAKSSDELEKAAAAAVELGLPLFVFGGGSNMLISDDGIRGLVVRTSNQGLSIEDGVVVAESGATTGLVSTKIAEAGLSGFAWAVGVPGKIGGAVCGNAGAYGGEMRDCVELVSVWRDGEVVEMSNEECEFGYRHSIFKEYPEWVILTVKMRFDRADDVEAEKAKLRQILLDRKSKQPVEFPTAGCMFANWKPKSEARLVSLRDSLDLGSDDVIPVSANGTVPAGWIVEKAGLKGMAVGKVSVSEKHGNFFVTESGATADEVIQLLAVVKTRVRNATGGLVGLREEVQLVGF